MIVGTNGEAVELSAFRDGEGEGGRWSEATAAGVGAGDGGLAIGVGRGATTTAEGAETVRLRESCRKLGTYDVVRSEEK